MGPYKYSYIQYVPLFLQVSNAINFALHIYIQAPNTFCTQLLKKIYILHPIIEENIYILLPIIVENIHFAPNY